MSGTTTQNVVQTNLPAYAEPYYKQLMEWAGQAYSPNQPYITYGGDRLAGHTADQNMAFGLTTQLPEGYEGDFDAARQAAQQMSGIGGTMQGISGQVGGIGTELADIGRDVSGGGAYQARDYENMMFTPDQYQAAMDPFLGNVLDRAQARATERFNEQQMLRDQAAARTGAFGGSRQYVSDAMAQRDLNNQLLDLEASTLSNAFNQAQNFLTGQRQLGETSRQFETNTALRGADILGMGGNMLNVAGNLQGAAGNLIGASGNLSTNIGTQENRADLSTIDALLKTGGLQQQWNQRAMDLAYQDFLNQRDWQRDMLGGYSSILRGMPVGQNSVTTGTSTPGSPSTLNQIIGGATALYPLASKLFD
jgi:hypothetical protein